MFQLLTCNVNWSVKSNKCQVVSEFRFVIFAVHLYYTGIEILNRIGAFELVAVGVRPLV
jgi:hypothetical protein